MKPPTIRHAAALATVALFACACATPPPVPVDAAKRPAAQSVLRTVNVDKAIEDRILSLDPERVTVTDVRETLAKGPAPQIMLMHGGIYPVHLAMTSAGRFFTGMGYPESRIRHPGDRRWSHSPYEDSAQLAGLLAWYYERDGMRPMIVAHSQGGIQAVKVLYELAGRFQSTVAVWDPYSDSAEDRTTIVDPLTGMRRPVVGVELSYVSVVGAGGAALLLPNQWSMIDRMRTVPDTVVDFTGFSLGFDPMAWTVAGVATTDFRHDGTARVRNVVLPATYNHLTIPAVAALADDQAARDWIDAYRPDATMSDPPSEKGGYGVVWAADVWYSVKKHWVLEAQRLIRAKRALPPA